MRSLVLLAICLAVVSAAPSNPQRIVGGELTTIEYYPSIVAILYFFHGDFIHGCGGTILNQRAILSSAHCFVGGVPATHVQVRVGSTYANSGGNVYNINTIIRHPAFNVSPFDSDISILHAAGTIQYSSVVQPAYIAGPNYNPADNSPVWAAGWGATRDLGPWSEQLRHVQVYIINQDICNERYRGDLTPNMLCSGILDVGGRDQCTGDAGGPLFHNDIVVGVTSFGFGCGSAWFPGVNVRVSRFTSWIQSNA